MVPTDLTHVSATDHHLTHRDVLVIAVPIILSNVTEPLIGVADTAVLGQIGEPHLIGAVALGATIFSMLFWAFGFLRMGTSGLTAQADGAHKPAEVLAVLARALLIGVTVGVMLVGLQWPIAVAVFATIQGSEAVERAAKIYFEIRIWSAPAALANFAILGWFIGIRRTDLAFVLQILLNILNIGLDVLFVIGMGYGVEGVAYGTIIAQIMAVCIGLLMARRQAKRRGALPAISEIVDRAKLLRTLSVNRDIMIRTLLLLAAFVFFVTEGARAGDLILAANAVLYHLVAVSAHFLDGFAYSAEVLVGNAVGARQRSHFSRAVKLTSLWAGVVSLLICLAYWLGGVTFINWMTASEDVRAVAREYHWWAVFIPVIGVSAYQLDGIFIGATRTADMRNMSMLSTGAYFAAWAILTPTFGNHGLWASLVVLFLARALSLLSRYPTLTCELFPTNLGLTGKNEVQETAS